MATSPFLSIIIPCYNELSNLNRGVLGEVKSYLELQEFSWEVIISDDASTDGSLQFVEKFVSQNPGFKLVKNPKGGKAFAIRGGVNQAKGEFVLFTDMDQSTPLNQLDKFKPHLNQKSPVIIGSRGFKRENFPILRKIASPLFLLFRRFLILPRIKDTQCGFKCFQKSTVKRIFERLTVFKLPPGAGWRVGAWDVELLYIATKMKLPIIEITVDWSDTDTSDSKQRKFIQESVEMLKEVARVRIKDILGGYEV